MRPHTPWWLHSRLHPARHVALALVALFEVWEAGLLWRRGLEFREALPLALGFVVLLLLLAFEIDERSAMRRERELGREIAEWLVPRVPPSIPKLDIAFSMRRAERVASDYFHVSPRWSGPGGADPPRVFLAMADVAGLGLQGALLMATFEAGLRALADARVPLDELATQLNRWSYDRSLEGRHFVMAFFGDLDPESGELRYVNSGHQPPLLLRATGSADSLELRGFPLGALADSEYEIGSTVMQPGDTLVIYTDGAVSAVDHRGEPFGEDRLRRALRQTRGLGATEVLNLLQTSVLSFAGSTPQRDDISVLVLRRTP